MIFRWCRSLRRRRRGGGVCHNWGGNASLANDAEMLPDCGWPRVAAGLGGEPSCVGLGDGKADDAGGEFLVGGEVMPIEAVGEVGGGGAAFDEEFAGGGELGEEDG